MSVGFPRWVRAAADLFLRDAHGAAHAGLRIATTPLRSGGRRAWLVARWRDESEANTGLYGDGPDSRSAAVALAAGLMVALYTRETCGERWGDDEERPTTTCVALSRAC